MVKVSSKVEEIDGKKYIVERDEKGKVICKSPYDEPITKVEPVIDIAELTDLEFREMVLKKLGYKIKEK